MRRLPGWRGRMQAFIAEMGAKPFDWATHDCGVAWAGRHIELMTGVDVAAPYRGRFTDAGSCAAMIAADGFASLPALVSSLLPEHLLDGRPAPSRARSGDIAAIAVPGPVGHSLGIVSGARILTVGARGYETVDLLRAEHAWRVGDA